MDAPDGLSGARERTYPGVVEDVVQAIREGTDKRGDGICPPMGVGPMGPFGGLTDQDAFDIAHYIKSLPPVTGERAEACPFPQL
jgi:cytochrome c553